jgi:hypothetical protein
VSTAARKPAPKAGDRRTTKLHGLQIRVHAMGRDPVTGKAIGRLFRNKHPVFMWRRPVELDFWDQYLLTEEERRGLCRGMLPVSR